MKLAEKLRLAMERIKEEQMNIKPERRYPVFSVQDIAVIEFNVYKNVLEYLEEELHGDQNMEIAESDTTLEERVAEMADSVAKNAKEYINGH